MARVDHAQARFELLGFTFSTVLRWPSAVSLFAAMLFAADVSGQSAPSAGRAKPISLSESQKRARPPVWSVDVLDAFFVDARAALVGPRPDYARRLVEDSTATRPQPQVSASWSTLIDAETIEAEIKRLAQAVAASVTSPGQFKGGGYQAARRQFSVLAVLFGVSSEYDGAVRWQDVAPGLRDAFAKAAQSAKVGSDASYSEAAARRQDLEALVRGERPQLPPAERRAAWPQVSDRPPLMQRMNAAQQERLAKWLANETEFAARREELKHEAQIIAMMADVIGREGYDYADDAEYAGFARQLREAAGEVSAAAASGEYEPARRALGRAAKACADCHEGYRG
jgi:hypothetical protein